MLKRLAPLHRGLFEDYVANFWCATHAFIKWKRLLPQQALVRACTAATLAALTPSCMHQIRSPSRLGLLYCMLNSSLAFFLFSYQVMRFPASGLAAAKDGIRCEPCLDGAMLWMYSLPIMSLSALVSAWAFCSLLDCRFSVWT